jgi:hypothetical protein
MKKIRIAFAILAAASFAACSGGHKKLVIVASGDIAIVDKTIKLDPSLTHNEKEMTYSGDKVTVAVQSTDGTRKTFDLTENGVYLLNLQKDTLIGGIVNYGATGIPGSITSDQLDHIIDSTMQLMEGKNASDEKKSFFVPPFTLKKISALPNARLVGSFKGIPYDVEADETGKLPEVFKFYTNRQKRETLNDLMKEREKIKAIH